MPKFTGMKLRCAAGGHWEMADLRLLPLDGGAYAIGVECYATGQQEWHCLAPDAADAERVAVVAYRHPWPSAVEAYAAQERWAQQGPSSEHK